jgi:hypothetical protein
MRRETRAKCGMTLAGVSLMSGTRRRRRSRCHSTMFGGAQTGCAFGQKLPHSVRSEPRRSQGFPMIHLRTALCVLILVLVQACATTQPIEQTVPTAPMVNLPPPYTQKNVEVVVERLWLDGYDNVIGVSGTATNKGPVNLLTCNIYLNVMDASGSRVSTAHATMIGLKSGETWSFQATFLSPFAGTFKAVEPGTIVAMNER